MPTGYTSDVADGNVTDLRTFALTCARGMGALISMRDEPWGAPVPQALEPSDGYYTDKLKELREELHRYAAMSPEQYAEAMSVEREETLAERRSYATAKAEKRARYESMIARVEGWSTEAEGLRDFMLSQLRDSLKFDCGDFGHPPVEDHPSAEDWLQNKLARITKDIGYYEKQRAEEVARTVERNRWLKALWDSLPAEGDAP